MTLVTAQMSISVDGFYAGSRHAARIRPGLLMPALLRSQADPPHLQLQCAA
jgi:hypothetical protein